MSLLLLNTQRSHRSSGFRSAVALVILVFMGIKLLRRPHVEYGTKKAKAGATNVDSGDGNTSKRPSILFTCPDGRIGLHLVHTRFLVGQGSASPLFVASRLQLMRTFLIPSLNVQTSKNFVYYASFDPNFHPSAARAFEDAVSSVTAAHTLALKQSVPAKGNWANLDFNAAIAKLAHLDPRVKQLDLLVTSRIDSDDSAHRSTVAAFQEYACAKGEASKPVRVAYPQGGQLWWPSAKENYGIAGLWKTGKGADDLYRVMSIFPTMVLSGKDFVRSCGGKINCYSMRHYQPEDLETLKIDGCKFKFNARKDILYWDPPKGEVSYLYIRTPSSWTNDKEDLKYRESSVDIEVYERSMGISRASLAATNLLFSGFQHDAPKLLEGKPSTAIEKR